MCFSSQASFIAGAALVSFSGFTLRLGWQEGARYLPLASFPLFFGIQQISEGFLWLSIEDAAADLSDAAALVFLFFAYWFWPFWVPLSSSILETDRLRRRIFGLVCVTGLSLGMLLYLPVLLMPENLKIYLAKHSIQYENSAVFPTETTKFIARLCYSAVICIPLVASTDPKLRKFGFLIFFSVIIGFLFASHAFTSIWCFLAAGLSAYIFVVLRASQLESPRPLDFSKS